MRLKRITYTTPGVDSLLTPRLIFGVAFAALSFFILWQEWRFWPFYIEDSYISLVYAKNWIAGKGLTYNGAVVEGYSNFLWVVLLGLVGFLGVDLELASRLLGMLFSILILPFLLTLGRELCGRSLGGWLAGGLLAVCGPFLAWAVGGLETTLYTLLLLLTLHMVLREQRAGGKPVSALAAILLSLTRPEGIGLVAAIVFYVALQTLRRVFIWQYLLYWIGIFTLGFGAFLLWRYLYYHDWIPASVLAKRSPLPAQIAVGIARLRPLLQAWWLAAVGAVVGFILLFVLSRERRSGMLLITLIAVADAAFVVFVGSDWMPMHRFVVPLLPLIFLALACAGVALAEVLSVRTGLPVYRWIVPFLFTIAPLLQVGLWTEQNREQAVAYDSISGLKNLALILAAEAPGGASLAVIDAGALAYYTGLPTLDLFGLNDQHIAHLPGSFGRRFDKVYVLAAKPTYLVPHYVLSDTSQPIFVDFLPFARLYYDVEFQRWYDIDTELPMHPFVRRQTPRERTMMDAFFKATYTSVTIKSDSAGHRADIEVIVRNDGTGIWVGSKRITWGAVYLVCRLREPATRELVAEQWEAIGQDLPPGEQRKINVELELPHKAGDYVLELDMVLNQIARFSEQGNPIRSIQMH